MNQPSRIRSCSIGHAAVVAVALVMLTITGPSARALDAGTLHIGDRLKITIYELVEMADRPVGDDQAANDTPPVQTAYPRLDLTGEYAIDENGRVMMPVIGGFAAADETVESFRTALDEAFTRTFRRRSNVLIAFAQRAPVYVVGSVRNPGAFTFTPGLFVMQAVALAGGDLLNASPGPGMDLVHQRQQRDAAQERLTTLILRRAALAAESAGTLALSAEEALSRLVGPERAADLLDREQKLLTLRRQGQAGARAIQSKAVDVAGEEVELLGQRMAAYDAQVKIRAERLRTMEALFSRQVVESERVADVRRDFADMEGRRRDLEISALQTRQRFEAAQKALEQTNLERRLALENDLNHVDGELREAQRAFAAAKTITALLERSATRQAEEGEVVAYEVQRRKAGALQTIQAGEIEPLEPGDVLKVVFRKPPSASDQAAAK